MTIDTYYYLLALGISRNPLIVRHLSALVPRGVQPIDSYKKLFPSGLNPSHGRGQPPGSFFPTSFCH